ncbi:uncharacterized protein LOC132204393 [Neocloeon triangulifer]|uniref:uncharacterized protein LOC132204393 n=1 Tax=Neocloeon triangulifer TaxID=2078957 RepID=UPI00286F91ED|nr:uncharacterized protein LOC132204393 [Neocloeon triangulifer]
MDLRGQKPLKRGPRPKLRVSNLRRPSGADWEAQNVSDKRGFLHTLGLKPVIPSASKLTLEPKVVISAADQLICFQKVQRKRGRPKSSKKVVSKQVSKKKEESKLCFKCGAILSSTKRLESHERYCGLKKERPVRDKKNIVTSSACEKNLDTKTPFFDKGIVEVSAQDFESDEDDWTLVGYFRLKPNVSCSG